MSKSRALLRIVVIAITALSLISIILTPVLYADQVTLSWDPVVHPDLAGYVVHYGTHSEDYDVSVDVGNWPSFTIVGLEKDQVYYFAVTAYSIHGERSDFSNEVVWPGIDHTIRDSITPLPNNLDYIEIEGPVNVSENTSADYNCRAYYTDGTSLLVEPDTWNVECASASISSTGLLTTYDVDADQDCQIKAYYLEGNITESDTYDTTIIDSNGNDPPLSDQLVSNVVVSSGEAYQVMPYGLQVGSRPYIDRTFYFTQVPGYLAGETYIQTANDDKESTGSDFLSFDVNQDVTVYVAHEDRIEPKPAWLLSFTDTGDQLVNTDKSLRIYARDFPAGKITLGGNQGSRYNSMYVVIVLAKIGSQTAILDRIEIEGSPTVSENNTVDYECRAYYTDSTNRLVEPNTWDVDCSSADISTTGLLTTFDVDADQDCQIKAYYLEGNITESDTYDTTIIDSNGNDPPLSDQLVSNVVVSSGEAYQVMPYGLQVGSRPYIDRTFYFTQVPGYLAGETYIQTANDDKESTGSDFLSFDVNQDVTVYVAHEDRIEPKPAWLLSFTDTGDRLVNTDKSLRIYARDFPAGKITLGGNQGSRYNSMYVVIVSSYGQ